MKYTFKTIRNWKFNDRLPIITGMIALEYPFNIIYHICHWKPYASENSNLDKKAEEYYQNFISNNLLI